MKLGYVAVFGFALGLAGLVPSNAQAEFSQTSFSHSYASKASIKVTEPAGFKVAVTLNGQASEDTIPHVFQVPDADAYVPMTITAPDGKVWSGKIEVKAHQQTLVAFKYSAAAAAAAPAAAPAARKFMGHVMNQSNLCKGPTALRYELMDEAGAVAKQVDLKAGEEKAVELPGGAYTVRLYTPEASGWAYQTTHKNLSVADDRWAFTLGCKRGQNKLLRIQ